MKKQIKDCNAKDVLKNFDRNKDNRYFQTVFTILTTAKDSIKDETTDEEVIWFALDRAFEKTKKLLANNQLLLTSYINLPDAIDI